MDPLTMAWYALTVLLLAIFVAIIILTKSRCGTRPPPRSATEPSVKPPTTRQQAPLTPAPAYSEFAPPSYDDAVIRHIRLPTPGASTAIHTTPTVFVITINEKSPVTSSLPVTSSSGQSASGSITAASTAMTSADSPA